MLYEHRIIMFNNIDLGSSGSASPSDGTYKDGKRYFRWYVCNTESVSYNIILIFYLFICSPVGFGLYVPMSKVYVKDDVI